VLPPLQQATTGRLLRNNARSIPTDQMRHQGPRGFFSFGIAAETESDQLGVARLDVASQFGLRFPLPANDVGPAVVEWYPPTESWAGLCEADSSPQFGISRGRQHRADRC